MASQKSESGKSKSVPSVSYANVIFANDSPQMIVFGDVTAELLHKLAWEDFEHTKWNYGNDYQRYRDLIYWHIHEVPVHGATSTSS